jgi:hypothetical protein
MSANDVPAPGLSTGFSTDEVIIYGIPLQQNGVIAVAVLEGGTGYTDNTKIRFDGAGAGYSTHGEAIPILGPAGAIKQIVVVNPGTYGDVTPSISIEDGSGSGAKAVAVTGPVAVLKIDNSRWNVGLVGMLDARRRTREDGPTDFVVLAAYGYAFEGHCYRFDKPRLIGLATRGDAEKVKGPLGCGFDTPAPGDPNQWYQGWRLRSNQRIIEMGMSVGRVEDIILDANRPSRRPPNTYASDMQLAHRSGRLMNT